MNLQSQPRVFVTQQPKPNAAGWTPNLSPATQFGTIHFIFSGSDNPSTDPDSALQQAKLALHDFRPDVDYLLWPNGVDPFSIWAALIVLVQKDVAKIKGLTWNRGMTQGLRDKQHGYYTPVEFRVNVSAPIITQSKEQQCPDNLTSISQPQPSQSPKQKASTSPVAKQRKVVNQ